VINVEMAFDPEVHIHRIGRTGRVDQCGLALSLCAPAEAYRVNAIEDYQRSKVHWATLPTAPGNTPATAPQKVTLQISGGRKDKLRPGDILGALTGDAGISGDQVGKIDLFDRHACVAVDVAVADKALHGLARIKGRPFKVRRI
jgi:ATP-independent RNA helicase DbpA